LYQCNRGIIYNRGKRKKIELDQENVTRKRQYSKAKYCNCGFKVKIVEPINKEKHIEVRLIISNGCLLRVSFHYHTILLCIFYFILLTKCGK
jgi:hypothetical protein